MRIGILLAVLLAGCTTAKTMMVDDRTAIISGRDMGWGNASDVTRKILITAAQIGRERGYEMFQIVGTQDTTTSGYVPIMGSSTTYGSAACYGGYCSGSATTTGTPGYLAPYTQAGADATVRFYHPSETPMASGPMFSVSAILGSTRK